MPTKCWEAKVDGHTIRIENSWTAGERLLVDGEVQDENKGLGFRARLEGSIPGSQPGAGRVRVSMGGWFTIHCSLFVDDKLVALQRVS